MDFKRVDLIEKEWMDQGKNRDIDYIWLAHGKYIRKNPDFILDTPTIKIKSLEYDLKFVRQIISDFYNKYILDKSKKITYNKCSITGGCRDGVKASLTYFKKTDDRNVLFMVPNYQPLIDIANNIFPKERIFYQKHFNEPYQTTINIIKKTIKEKEIGCIVITNPNNPAGIMYPDFFLSELARISNPNNILIIEDGAYFLHYSKKRQTSIFNHSNNVISNITAYKLLLSRTKKVGGAALSVGIDPDEFSKYITQDSYEEQIWFGKLLRKVSIEKPELLSSHLEDIFNFSNKVTNLFYDSGFVPLYKSIEEGKIKTSIGPVISLTTKSKSNEKMDPEELFLILKKHKILTTPMEEGIRINSRGITKEGIILLSNQLKKVKKEMKK